MSKTIEERAYDKFCNENCCRDCQNCSVRSECLEVDYVWAFIDGANSEHEELTRWNSPDCPPDNNKDVLLKIKSSNRYCPDSYYFEVGFYSGKRYYISSSRQITIEVLGWRKIQE